MRNELAQKTPPLSLAFCLICDLAQALKVSNVKDYPSAWCVQIDEKWAFAVNGKGDPIRVSGCGEPFDGSNVLPYSAQIFLGAFPIGVIDPTGGAFITTSENGEDAFIEAIHARIIKETGKPALCMSPGAYDSGIDAILG